MGGGWFGGIGMGDGGWRRGGPDGWDGVVEDGFAAVGMRAGGGAGVGFVGGGVEFEGRAVVVIFSVEAHHELRGGEWAVVVVVAFLYTGVFSMMTGSGLQGKIKILPRRGTK